MFWFLSVVLVHVAVLAMTSITPMDRASSLPAVLDTCTKGGSRRGKDPHFL